jgi:hypothetical protein
MRHVEIKEKVWGLEPSEKSYTDIAFKHKPCE